MPTLSASDASDEIQPTADRAKVILIGGPPGAGKTTLGRMLASRLGFASLTVDDLVVTARTVTTKATHPALHVMSDVGFVRYFTTGPPSKLIDDAEALASEMWPAVARVISSHAQSKSPVVIDWWLLSPHRVRELQSPEVRSMWLRIDPAALENRERANEGFFGQSAQPARMLSNFMARSFWRNDLVAAEAQRLGFDLLELSGAESRDDVADRAMARLAKPS